MPTLPQDKQHQAAQCDRGTKETKEKQAVLLAPEFDEARDEGGQVADCRHDSQPDVFGLEASWSE